MRRGKMLAAAVTVLAIFAMFTFAVSAEDAEVKNGWYSDKGYYEYFENGEQIKDCEYWIKDSYFRFDENGKMYENEWYHDEDYNYYYYQQGGSRADDCVVKIGDYYYGFDSNGIMYNDTEFYIWSAEQQETSYYKAGAGGPLVVNSWIYTVDSKHYEGGYYKYYGADGAAYRDIQQVNGLYYYFYYSGEMATEGLSSFFDYATESYRYVRVKEDGSLCRNEWYKSEYGNWYYYGDDCFAAKGLTTIGSATYYFVAEWNGQMLTDQTYYDGSCSYYADKNGYAVRLNPNTWTLIGKDYYYCVDGEVLSNQIATIGGSKYYFNYDGKMLNDETLSVWDDGTDYNIRAHAGGSLYRNEWYLNEWDSYSYYGDDCNKVKEGFVEIGGGLFYFSFGNAAQNELFETEDGVYVADAGCYVTKQSDGWVYFRNSYYYVEKDQLVRRCVKEIYGSKYVFDYEGRMYEKGVGRIDSDKGDDYYIITDSGAILTEQGWQQCDGEWYYVTEGGLLYNDQLELNGTTYFLRPALEYSTVDIGYDENGKTSLYLVTQGGASLKITNDGYYNTPYGRVLVENGAVFKGWKSIGTSRYYYSPTMYAGDYYEIGDGVYYFDNTGVMSADGWIPYDGTYLFADASGRLADGVVTVADKEYLFEHYELSYNDYAEYDGDAYVSDEYAIATKLNNNDWTFANGYWYYVMNGRVQTGSSVIDGDDYYFEYETGRMRSNYYDGNYYYGESGRRYEGWKLVDGAWYYFSPSKYQDTVRQIDGKDYCFDANGKMLVNTTYYISYPNEMVVIDASGAVTDIYNVPDGIIYQNGEAYMIKDGESYTGWYGDYYFRYGQMVIDEIISDKGNHYYIDKQGKYIRNSWYQRYEYSWIYAGASGALYYDEWLLYGNTWYYLDGLYMASGICYIEAEDKYAEFDENGRYLGYVDGYYDNEPPTGNANSWANINGKWYYYNSTGKMVANKTLYIDGRWYAFDYEGVMKTDAICRDYDSYKLYYYTSSGARLEAQNEWRLINGEWCYFGADSSVTGGWINISGYSYYIDIDYEYNETTDEETWSCELYTGYRLLNGKVYYFNEGGVFCGEYVGNGWLQLDNGDYVYFKDGKLLKDGIYNIYGYNYYFYSDGSLLIDDYDYINGSYVYASEGGVLYGAGWHLTNDGWIYVDDSGKLLMNGVYQIGGVVYFFYDGHMV